MPTPAPAAALVLGLALAAGPAAAGCTYPAPVPVPDGRNAASGEMAAAQRQVQAYVASMQQYLDCLGREEGALPEAERTPAARALTVKRHNAAVEAMERLAAQFNEQVRAYKAAGGR
jgi:hypothetical protein